MKSKLKICHNCRELRMIWKCHEGESYCKVCWQKRCAQTKTSVKGKPTHKIPRRTLKHVKDDKEYKKLRKAFLTEYPMCQIHITPECTAIATDIHHTYAGSNRELYYLDTTTWKATCRTCHQHIHTFINEAKQLNFLK